MPDADVPSGSVSLVVGGIAQDLHHLSERLEEQLAVPGEELDAVQNNLFQPKRVRERERMVYTDFG